MPEGTDSTITVTVPESSYEDTTGNPGQPGTGTVDTVPPTVEVIINDDGTVSFKFSEEVKDFVLGDVIITGGKLNNLVKNEDGTWRADLTDTQQGTTVKIDVKDKSYSDLVGNEGSSGTDKEITVKIDSIKQTDTGSIITGTTEHGNTVEVTLPDGSKVTSDPADEQGHWTVLTDKPLSDGTMMKAETEDQDGKPTTDEVPLPFVSIDVIAVDDFINKKELEELTDENGFITITGTVSNLAADMTVTFNGKEYGI